MEFDSIMDTLKRTYLSNIGGGGGGGGFFKSDVWIERAKG